MKQLTYNIDCNFTFELVCSKLIKFWKEEVIILNKNKKIWLTISIVNENNRSFILIKNLPFYISDFTDITIVLKQIFDSKILSNRKEKLSNISFQYYIEDNKKNKSRINYKPFIKNTLFFIKKTIFFIVILFLSFSLTIITLNLLLDIYQVINFDIVCDKILEHVDDKILEHVDDKIHNLDNRDLKEAVNSKYCVFDPFIRLFDLKNHNYVESKFLPSLIKAKENDFNLLEYIIYKQYIILDYNVTDWNKLLTDLDQIIKEYTNMKGIAIN